MLLSFLTGMTKQECFLRIKTARHVFFLHGGNHKQAPLKERRESSAVALKSVAFIYSAVFTEPSLAPKVGHKGLFQTVPPPSKEEKTLCTSDNIFATSINKTFSSHIKRVFFFETTPSFSATRSVLHTHTQTHQENLDF